MYHVDLTNNPQRWLNLKFFTLPPFSKKMFKITILSIFSFGECCIFLGGWKIFLRLIHLYLQYIWIWELRRKNFFLLFSSFLQLHSPFRSYPQFIWQESNLLAPVEIKTFRKIETANTIFWMYLGGTAA